MILKPLIALVATSVLAVKLARHLNPTPRQRRAKDDPQRHRDDMHRWEGEGGNLPPTPQR